MVWWQGVAGGSRTCLRSRQSIGRSRKSSITPLDLKGLGAFENQRTYDLLHRPAVLPSQLPQALYACVVEIANCDFVHDSHPGLVSFAPIAKKELCRFIARGSTHVIHFSSVLIFAPHC